MRYSKYIFTQTKTEYMAELRETEKYIKVSVNIDLKANKSLHLKCQGDCSYKNDTIKNIDNNICNMKMY